MTEPKRTIEVICDDPRHARGKVAKIATVTVDSAGTWSRRQPEGRRLARVERRMITIQDRRAWTKSMFGTDTIRCKLCGRHLPRDCGEELVRRVRQLADAGESPVSLARLAVLVSMREAL